MKKLIVPISIFLIGLQLSAQEKDKQIKNDSIKKLDEVIVNGKTNKFKREKSTSVSKMPLSDIENPQVYNAIPAELLKEQVVTNFNDALKNATGVTRLWESTGRGGDGAEFYSMRGFAVQPTMVNGLPGINNGSIDPVNVDNLEVIKGPSGTLFGSSLISYGGLINIVTKKPYSNFGGEISYNAGTYGMNRITADINTPLTQQKDVLLRVTTAYQTENSFQDAGFGKSLFFAPSLTYIVNDRLKFLVNTEFTSRNSANAPMLFINRSSPVSFNSIDLFEQNYKNSFTSNELSISNPTFNMQGQMLYTLNDSWTSQTVLSRSSSKTDGYYSYLWDLSDGNTFFRFISKRNGETFTTDIQQNFIGDFKIGNFRNRIVAGLDYYKSNIMNGSSGYVGNGLVTLADGNDTGDLTQAGVDNLLVGSFEGNSTAENEVFSAYASDVFNVTPQFSAMVSGRLDHFKGQTQYWSTDESKGQTAFSPKFGLVYQPIINRVSIFANYMNGFVNVAPKQVSDADGTNTRMKSFDPEHAKQYEFGVKTNLYKDKVSITASYYNIYVKNKITSDPYNINNTNQGAEVESKGIEISIIASPIKGLNIVGGFSNNHSETKKDDFYNGYLGLRPEEAGPETLVNLWTSYTVPNGKLKGLGFGFGGNYASDFKTLNRGTILVEDTTTGELIPTYIGSFELPEYVVLNTGVSYNNDKFIFNLKLNNLLNEKYFSGWSTVTPQKSRNLTAGLTFRF
ncbi:MULTISPECIES: TonB-dependent siderophore receptor [Flavobacterium]|uniref:TonB-dependent siderophore receptor n=1 Tax=Flavobacterium TaxID=237 RepID=UPI001FCBB060|nr:MULTISPECIES: TonB-dependent receptor [Flavobacterium]UOK42359.1 TonB-dependent receptor [Flavobacterium enshiense]